MNFLKWFFQIFTASILTYMAFLKLTDYDMSVHVFKVLEMEPVGRYIIASLELIAAMLLTTKVLPVYGATLSVAIMLGAALAHLTRLGIVVQGDDGFLFFMMVLILISSNIVLYLNRNRIPGVSSDV